PRSFGAWPGGRASRQSASKRVVGKPSTFGTQAGRAACFPDGIVPADRGVAIRPGFADRNPIKSRCGTCADAKSGAWARMHFGAVLFDFDGILVDTEWEIYDAWYRTFRRNGHPLPLEIYTRCIGSDF